MSNRVRKQSDGPCGKGPMRATLPVSSVMRQTAGVGVLRKSCGNSPTLSPTNAWRRGSPDSGQRSPGALHYRDFHSPGGKSRPRTELIRRTASLDTLYHKGQWPKDIYVHSGNLQIDKSTQTEEGSWPGLSVGPSTASTSMTSLGRAGRTEDDKPDNVLRLRLQRTPHKSPPAAQMDQSQHTMSPVFFGQHRYAGSSMGPLRAAHSSVEALNQEIERLVLCPSGGGPPPLYDRQRDKSTPDGHRAPLAEMLRRSVNTQTPQDSSSQTTHSSGGSVSSSPDVECSRLGTSPHINRFLARKPPDGCEKVELKCSDATTCVNAVCAATSETAPRPSVTGFTLRPSLGSAFQPLPPTAAPTSPTSPPPSAKKTLRFPQDEDEEEEEL